MRQSSETALPSVEMVLRAQVAEYPAWAQAFNSFRKSRRYYELVEDTICPELDYRYFVIRKQGSICAIQPFFFVDQDLLAGLGAGNAFITALRRLWPNFMRVRILMVGCAAGEGHLDGADESSKRESVRLLANWLNDHRHELKAWLIVFKDFPATERQMLNSLAEFGYRRIASLPAVRLKLGYASFDEYMRTTLSRNARMHLRRALRASASVEVETVGDITPFINEVYPLYLQVFERSAFRFEKLTEQFFCELGRRMPDKARFFLWRLNGRIVAFSTCMLDHDALCAEYLGLDYSVALDLHLYYRVFHDEVSWAIANKYTWYRSGQVGYDPKLHLRFLLEPLDLFIRPTMDGFNVVFSWLLPFIEPARNHPVLTKFANYSDL